MEKYFILKDSSRGARYYISEGNATFDQTKALRIKSINELITTIPIMKDWNWDYELFEVSGNEIKKVDEKSWTTIYYKWKDENPNEWAILYAASGISSFITKT